GLNPIRFPWLKPRAIFDNIYAKKNIACGFNRRNTKNVRNDYVFRNIEFEMHDNMFPVVKPRAIFENRYVKKNKAHGFNRGTFLIIYCE
ncbi:hypothetical protein ABXT06_16640, partial [Flavobacterium sp. UW10123]|uniref:hypothetical protein n=1 Tax=Flavobacterium sp. UW10123 TaxID=3230800 RepID=UPI003398FDB7